MNIIVRSAAVSPGSISPDLAVKLHITFRPLKDPQCVAYKFLMQLWLLENLNCILQKHLLLAHGALEAEI